MSDIPRITSTIADVCQRHSVTRECLVGQTRARPVVIARDEACALLRERGLSFPAIGRLFNRDHTTIIAAVRRHNHRSGT